MSHGGVTISRRALRRMGAAFPALGLVGAGYAIGNLTSGSSPSSPARLARGSSPSTAATVALYPYEYHPADSRAPVTVPPTTSGPLPLLVSPPAYGTPYSGSFPKTIALSGDAVNIVSSLTWIQ